jgi:hypothetical protein
VPYHGCYVDDNINEFLEEEEDGHKHIKPLPQKSKPGNGNDDDADIATNLPSQQYLSVWIRKIFTSLILGNVDTFLPSMTRMMSTATLQQEKGKASNTNMLHKMIHAHWNGPTW